MENENEIRRTNNEKESTIWKDDDFTVIFRTFPMIFQMKCFVRNIKWHAHLDVVRKLVMYGIRTHLNCEWTTGDES